MFSAVKEKRAKWISFFNVSGMLRNFCGTRERNLIFFEHWTACGKTPMPVMFGLLKDSDVCIGLHRQRILTKDFDQK